jgi:uncharacterized protein YgiM (DUF1202 family)
MKKTIVLLLCLALVSLACVSTALSAVSSSTDEPTGTPARDPAPAGAVYWMTEPIETRTLQVCAVVIADQALHLRNGPNIDAEVLGYLMRGDVVKVISDLDSNWSRVRSGTVEGYARGEYLEESECK